MVLSEGWQPSLPLRPQRNRDARVAKHRKNVQLVEVIEFLCYNSHLIRSWQEC